MVYTNIEKIYLNEPNEIRLTNHLQEIHGKMDEKKAK